MRHTLCRNFYKLWSDSRLGDAIPTLESCMQKAGIAFERYGVVFARQGNNIVYDFCGPYMEEALGGEIEGREVTSLYPEMLKPAHNMLLDICFTQKIGVERLSRYWFGHRHKEVEWLLLPVLDERRGEVVMMGLSAAFAPPCEKDIIAAGSEVMERVIGQNYLSLGGEVDVNVIDGYAWAVLNAMGTTVSVDDQAVDMSKLGFAGDAAMAAKRASHANVLAVAEVKDFGRSISRLGARYNFKIVETIGEARDILLTDTVDILVTSERVNGGRGMELIEEIQETEAETACVLMLDPRTEAEDTLIKTSKGHVHCVVKPVGEFSLRRALDDADLYVKEKFRQQHLGK